MLRRMASLVSSGVLKFLGGDPDLLGGSNFAKFLREAAEKAKK